eukprot:TRINITY_DN4577_c0_g1_i1.p1 TRINITY_DN4577_c0_g1~~TRINITY_DN4577_c0_g1_i1.p1  ORF type:complete len:117 (-),score=10.27 TRINITY_DN4577_c0_g1_i1:524-874(-)
MFFAFIASVAPEVGRILGRASAQCPRCSSQMVLAECKTVLRVFFVPVWKWGADEMTVLCEQCGFTMPYDKLKQLNEEMRLGQQQTWERWPQQQCGTCGAPCSPGFRFCPNCGTAQN